MLLYSFIRIMLVAIKSHNFYIYSIFIYIFMLIKSEYFLF